MAPDKAAAHASAAGKAADVSAAETAYASATTEPTHVSAAEPAADVSAAAETPTVPAPAARKRISGHCRGESGSRGQYDHRLT